MKDGYSSGKSLGLGLPGTKRLVSEFDIKSVVGVGTTVTIIKWKNG
jgi:serine/threonine-protein kinase RsbT